jgi:ribosomal protein S27E
MTLTAHQAQQIQTLRAQGQGYRAIATAVGLTRDDVRNHCRGHGLETPTAPATAAPPIVAPHSPTCCPACGQHLTQPRTGRKRKYCSDACRRAWWAQHPEALHRGEAALYPVTCAHCGQTFTAYGNRSRRFCGLPCYFASRFQSKA